MGKGEKDPAEKSLRICTLNTRSLVNKTVEVLEHINDWNCDICLVQETFFKTSDNAKQQLNLHLESNNLYSTVQSGYRKHHSCETLLVRMSDDILKDINKDKVVVLLLLDLSAAFDTIDHDLLIWKLLTQYGIDGNALDWFTNYLSNRKFTVKINSKICDFFCLLFGVPQGSLLGPVLFVLYVKALENIARKYGLRVQMYADDSQLYITLDPIDNSHWDFCKDRIESCLKDIRQWMTKNFMKINESKTELLLIGKKKDTYCTLFQERRHLHQLRL